MTLRVAVVGLGWAARTIWLPRLVGHPGITVTAVVDPDPVARASCATRAGNARSLSSPDELTPDLADLAVVAVPNHAHAPVACGLLRRGIPVFLEKPVCLSTAEADDLAAAEAAGGAVLVAGSAARYRADVRALEELLPSLGRIRHVELAWVRSRGVPGTDWFTRRHAAGGGALVDLGWHLLDTALPLLGPVRIDQVAAVLGHDFVRHGDSQAVWREEHARPADPGARDVEDTARAMLVTDSGVSVAVRASWASHARYDTTVVEIHGTAGTAALRCTFGFSPNREGAASLTVHRDGDVGRVPLDEEPPGTEYDRQVADLAALVGDPAQRGRAVAAARTTIGAIELIYDSAQKASAGARNSEEEPAWTGN
ncbi:Gfo/Idh/MocA family protein [Streptomyces viridochromogenes]|uniref:Gfo/Idh/MocA family protein n=1 Tax=Streptomyces viridochromogenes TaxID=1938 RepID=UPI00069DE05E|nr:Gfo/Idh/MocA family oxidoreductase [Streptomyces viridochromogenes]KOG07348.1 oxidoreductase [Streptomyces viridochromogenes]KOG07371.1 oxidoreductase [Streptomyces viridochromogenes]